MPLFLSMNQLSNRPIPFYHTYSDGPDIWLWVIGKVRNTLERCHSSIGITDWNFIASVPISFSTKKTHQPYCWVDLNFSHSVKILKKKKFKVRWEIEIIGQSRVLSSIPREEKKTQTSRKHTFALTKQKKTEETKEKIVRRKRVEEA